jgi:ankyrin repeat protein
MLAAVNTEKGAAGLSWVQLEKCDGLHLVDKTSCLGLTAWTQKERDRRQALTNAAGAANKAARAALSEDEEAGEAWLTNADGEPLACKLLDQELGDALQRGDLDAAKKAFANGADPSLYDASTLEEPDEGFPDDRERPEDITWLTKHDLEALGANDEETLEKEILAAGNEDDDGILLPLICKAANNLTICNWLLDVGVDVNSRQPYLTNSRQHEEQGEFGGMNVLVLANTLEAVEMLCARGADADCTYALPRFPETCNKCTARGIVAADTSDGAIARCLVRHGANVNVIFAPDTAQEKDATGGIKISLNEASICDEELTFDSELGFGSYWKTVVASGDVVWAADLLRTYGANANWPVRTNEETLYKNQEKAAELHEHAADYYSQQEVGCDDDFSTVLIIAARMENLPMVRLLLEQGADVNEARPDFAAVDAGCDDNKLAETPLSVALGTGNAHVIELLKSKGATK